MAINNDADLQKAIDQANGLIQDIHDYAVSDFSKSWRLRFPCGYVRTATEQQQNSGHAFHFFPMDR